MGSVYTNMFNCFTQTPYIFHFRIFGQTVLNFYLIIAGAPYFLSINPVDIQVFKVNNGNTSTPCEICSKLTVKIQERYQNIYQISDYVSVSDYVSDYISDITLNRFYALLYVFEQVNTGQETFFLLKLKTKFQNLYHTFFIVASNLRSHARKKSSLWQKKSLDINNFVRELALVCRLLLLLIILFQFCNMFQALHNWKKVYEMGIIFCQYPNINGVLKVPVEHC